MSKGVGPDGKPPGPTPLLVIWQKPEYFGLIR